MILLIILRVWQIVAEKAPPATLPFGAAVFPAYVDGVAGVCVTFLPESYFEIYPSPPLGLVAPQPGPFFLRDADFARNPPIPVFSRPLARATRT